MRDKEKERFQQLSQRENIFLNIQLRFKPTSRL